MGTTSIGRHARRGALALAGVLCGAALVASAAQAAAPLAWAVPVRSDSTAGTLGLTALSCPSSSLCVAVDDNGQFLSSTAPASGAWGAVASIAASVHPLSAISCPAAALCFAVDKTGNVYSSATPTSSSAWTLANIDGLAQLNAISCPSTSLCFAADNGGSVLTSPTPSAAPWSTLHIDGANHVTALSCPTASLCAAVDDHGNVLISTTPTAGGSWQATQIVANTSIALTAVSCNAAGLCVAVAHDGSVHATANAASPTPTWSATTIDSGNVLTAVSCADVGLCVAVDNNGSAFESDNPAAGPPAWTMTAIDAGHPALNGVSCLSAGFCVAVDAFGDTIAATLPAPAVTTGVGAASSQTAATVAATVNPNDATLSDCHFDYGPTTAYGTSVPCTVVPSAGGGSQGVVAALSGLSAATTYHFRIVASSGVAAAAGADASFATPPPLKANPSISGTSAVGATLTCKANVTTTATETVTYAWLRDTVAIPGASVSTYVIVPADETHHLSCQVTIAGDGATVSATSGFDGVPSQTQGKITESFVGTAQRQGTSASAPVTCSVQASGACTITLRLTVSQMVRHKSQTVTVGFSTTKLAAGKTRTLSVSLNATGRRLLKKQHTLAATLTVSGTIIGKLTAKLQTDKLVFGKKAKHATRHPR